MTATTLNRDTKERDCSWALEHHFGVLANEVIPQGVLVALTAAGFLVNVTSTTALIVCGRSEEAMTGSAVSGAKKCRVRSSIFRWANDTGTPVVQAGVGGVVYGLDNQTVTGDSTGRSIAGRVYEVGTGYVDVSTPFPSVSVHT